MLVNVLTLAGGAKFTPPDFSVAVRDLIVEWIGNLKRETMRKWIPVKSPPSYETIWNHMEKNTQWICLQTTGTKSFFFKSYSPVAICKTHVQTHHLVATYLPPHLSSVYGGGNPRCTIDVGRQDVLAPMDAADKSLLCTYIYIYIERHT